jgi:hypothetical protein
MKRRHGAVWLAPVLSVLVAVLVAVVVAGVANAISFNPTLTASVSDPTAGANTDVTTDFGIPKGDAQFAVTSTLTPPQFTVAKDADVPNGAMVGKLEAVATLGLINQPCTSALPVNVDLLDATTDASAGTVTFDDQFQDADGNTLPDGVDKYPELLTRMYPGLTPRARYFGQASVAGSAVSLNFIIFEPGTTLPGLGALDPALGYPSVYVLNDNGDPGATPAPNPITDFCTPLSTKITTFALTKDNKATTADESGKIVSTNPAAAGTYTFRSISISNLDADDDGIENGLDTCPFDKDTGTDTDSDGIDDVCDPEPTVANTDQDDDLYMNRGDTCPLVANGADQDNQKDTDTDGIGDLCDTTGNGPTVPDGTPVKTENTADVEITGGAAAASPTAAAASPTAAAPSPTAAPGTAVASPTKAATAAASPTKTAVASPVATAQPPQPGGGGLLEGDEGFPTWAFFVIGVAAVLLLGSLGTAVTVTRRRNR